MILLLSSCDTPSPRCLESYVSGDTHMSNTTVNSVNVICSNNCANQCIGHSNSALCMSQCQENCGYSVFPTYLGNYWADTGIYPSAGDGKVGFSVTGSINMCGPNPNYDLNNDGVLDKFLIKPLSSPGDMHLDVKNLDLNFFTVHQYNKPSVPVEFKFNEGIEIVISGELQTNLDNFRTHAGTRYRLNSCFSKADSLENNEPNSDADKKGVVAPCHSIAGQGLQMLIDTVIDGQPTQLVFDGLHKQLEISGTEVADFKALSNNGNFVAVHYFSSVADWGESATISFRYKSAWNEAKQKPKLNGNQSVTGGYTISIAGLGCSGGKDYLVAANGSGNRIYLKDVSGDYFTSPGNDSLLVKVVNPYGDTIPNYAHHSGSLQFSAGIPKSAGFLSTISNYLIKLITDMLYGERISENSSDRYWDRGIVPSMYKGFIQDGFREAVQALLVLYIAFYFFALLMGSLQVSYMDLMQRIFKIAFIVLLISKDSWDFFIEYFGIFFIDGVNILINMFLAGSSFESMDVTSFAFMDKVVGVFFVDTTWIRMGSLFSLGLYGWVMFFIYLYIFLLLLIVFIEALMAYMMAIMVIALLIAIAPVFIPFVLFEVTRGLFQGWIKSLLSYILQPVIIFVSLGIFGEMVYASLMTIVNLSVCWGCMQRMDIVIFSFCLIPYYVPWAGGESETPISIFMVITTLLMADSFRRFIPWAMQVGVKLTDGAGGQLGSLTSSMMSSTGMDRVKNRIQETIPDALAKLPGAGLKKATRFTANQTVGRAHANIKENFWKNTAAATANSTSGIGKRLHARSIKEQIGLKKEAEARSLQLNPIKKAGIKLSSLSQKYGMDEATTKKGKAAKLALGLGSSLISTIAGDNPSESKVDRGLSLLLGDKPGKPKRPKAKSGYDTSVSGSEAQKKLKKQRKPKDDMDAKIREMNLGIDKINNPDKK